MMHKGKNFLFRSSYKKHIEHVDVPKKAIDAVVSVLIKGGFSTNP